jgi:hypothetical protein
MSSRFSRLRVAGGFLLASGLAVLSAAPAAAMRSDGPEPAPAPVIRADSVAAAQPFHVGLQVGHWKSADLPASLARLRGSTGTAGGGRSEINLNLDVTNRAARLLRAAGVVVDVLPATVPTGYLADAFVAIHADGNNNTAAHGFKIATRWRSGAAFYDQTLVESLGAAYSDATGLARDGAITRNMRGYYAFNTWLGDDARISDSTPAAIIETGYMTSAADRRELFNHTDDVAAGIARGVLNFLHNRSAVAAVQARAERTAAASPTGRSAIVIDTRVALRASASGSASVLAWANRGDSLIYLDTTARPRGPITGMHGGELAVSSGYFRVALPGAGTPAYVNRDSVIVQQPSP